MRDGAVIAGEAYYSGSKVVGAKVEVFAPDGVKLGETVTDENGAFKFEAKFKCDLEFVVTDGTHRATATIPAADLPDTLQEYGEPLSEADDSNTALTTALDSEELTRLVEKAVAGKVQPLERELKNLKDEVRFHDILGGIGYLVGVMGVVFYFLGILRRGRTRSGAGEPS